jgi:hypothetical protein
MHSKGGNPATRKLRFEPLEVRQMLSSSSDLGEPELLLRAPNDAAAEQVAAENLTFGSLAGVVEVPRGRPTLNPEGTTFVAENGNLLRGPFASTEWGAPPPLANIQAIKQSGANAIHLYGEVFNPNYTGVPGPGDEPGYAVSRIDQMVQMTRSEDLYLVLTIGNGGNNGSFNYDYVMDFWEFYAPRYKDEAHVLFEIQNEPHAWSAPYPQAALDMEADAYTLIRSLAPDTPILLFSFAVLGNGGQAVTDINKVSTAASIDWSNAGVAFHGYAGHQDTPGAVQAILNAGYPVFMTEFTASDWGTDVDVADVELIAELERLKVSWLTFQHIPPNFIGTAFTDAESFRNVIDRAGISWEPDFGTWPVPRGVYGNGGQARATTGLTGTLRIEAEHFDTGGQGVAYSDADAANLGGQLRLDEGVDLEATTDTGGGHNVTATVDGEWLEYTVFVREPGFYNLRLRVASLADGAARVILDGEDTTGSWTLPATGGLQTWSTVTKQVFLKYGRQKLRLEIPTGEFNLNWIELSPATSGAIANGAYKILNRNSALALEADTANQTVEQNQYTGATNERWTLMHRGAGQYSITSVANNWSWNTFYDNNGEPVTLAPWGYDGHADRRFIIAPVGDGSFKILVADGGLSVEMGGASLANAAPAEHSEYQGEAHQHWAIVAPAAPSFPAGLTAGASESLGVLGDYNDDGVVDTADYTLWRNTMGEDVADYSGADGNGNGMIDQGDYLVWKRNFGETAESFAVNLSWSAVAGATSYNIKRSNASGGPWVTIATGVTDTAHTDAMIAGEDAPYYVVSATSASGESLNSAEAKPAVLHAHLKFDEASGSAADSTGNGWTGTMMNGPLRTAGFNGNAVDLDGSNDHVRLPTGVVNGLTTTTLATWVQLDFVVNWTRIFDFGSSTSVNMFLSPRSGITSLPVFAITTSGSGGEQRINSNVAIAPNAWTHVAVTLNGSTGILYINGVEVGRNNGMTLTPSSMGATTLNYIGRSQYSDPYLNGRVDDFRIYDGALSPAEVAALAAAAPGAGSVSLFGTVEPTSRIETAASGSNAVPLDVARSAERFENQLVTLRQDSGRLQSRRDGLAEHFASRRRAVDEAFAGELTRGGELLDDATWSQLRESHQETEPACARALRGLEMKTRLTIGNSFVRTGI